MLYDKSSSSNVSVVDKPLSFMRTNAEKHFQWHKGVLQERYSVVKAYCHDLKINTEQHFQSYEGVLQERYSVVKAYCHDLKINTEQHFQSYEGVLQERYSMVKAHCHDLKINTKQHFQDCEGVLQKVSSIIKLHSQDLRGRVVKAVKQGAARTEVAHMFNVSVSAVKWYLRRCREQSHGLLKLISGSPLKKLVPLPVGVHLNPRTKMERRATLRNF